MARIRTIKPELPQSESLGRVSREARLCFILLFTQADDVGRLRGNSRMLASLLFPYDDDAKDLIGGWLAELESAGCIRQYVSDGDHYIDIPKWLSHQKIDHPSESKLPAFDEGSRTLAKPREISLRIKEGKGSRIKDQGCASASDDGFEDWYGKYPRKVGRAQACKAFKAALKKTDIATLAAGLERYRVEVAGKEPGFIAHPATWLNGERWLDEPGGNTEPVKTNGHATAPPASGGGIADSVLAAADVRKRRAAAIKDGDPKGGTSFIIPRPELQKMMAEGLLTMTDLEQVGLAG